MTSWTSLSGCPLNAQSIKKKHSEEEMMTIKLKASSGKLLWHAVWYENTQVFSQLHVPWHQYFQFEHDKLDYMLRLRCWKQRRHSTFGSWNWGTEWIQHENRSRHDATSNPGKYPLWHVYFKHKGVRSLLAQFDESLYCFLFFVLESRYRLWNVTWRQLKRRTRWSNSTTTASWRSSPALAKLSLTV